ncbi:glycosyltransferase 87 family protein [Amycolatopsis thermophila]|uniref:Alpha-1,2-mannosyltransferase n=1 Tax=Amycolatopsis thermophila TaxID=206084 RepID=A0ABU0EZ84_9PSEU|nr:glycosyltransferase 87 family protein [Amycolatopsis thermophila]MDQ0380256.1 alpha-1,2-mannosyltransferase [Amycolatopsis thermophila]
MPSSAVETTAARPAPREGVRRPLPWAAFWPVLVLGAVAGFVYVRQVLAQLPVLMHLLDLGVYQIAGERVLDGVSVYDTPLLGNVRGEWEFVYTPFAALLFAPLAPLHGDVFTWVGALGDYAMLAVGVWAALSLLRFRRDVRLVLFSLPVAALLMWCEPIRETMAFGQVNILLMTLVLVDVALPDSSKVKGALIGIAAGIKLTPAFFVLYLVVTRRYRAAIVSVVALVATVAIGFAFLWHDSVTFWSGAFADPTRVGVPENPSNESLRGFFARATGVTGGMQIVWLLAAAATAVVCLLLARRLAARGEELVAVTLCGLGMTAVSPYSWVHHWVWLAMLLICLANLAFRGSVWGWIGLVGAGLVTSGGVLELLGFQAGTVLNFKPAGLEWFFLNGYLWLTFAVFVAVALYYRAPAKTDSASSR